MQQSGTSTGGECAGTGLGTREVAAIAHDLRNPLSAALCSVGAARRTGEERHFDRAERSLRRMDEMIDDLLALGRCHTAGSDAESVSLRTAAERAWETTRTGMGSLAVDTDGSLEADPAALDVVLSNLFDNAVVHADGEVTVRVGHLGSESGFFVSDDGPGIPPAEREQVFEFGYSLDGDGTGYGLAIVTRIAAAHGWDVTLTESDAGGARFEFA